MKSSIVVISSYPEKGSTHGKKTVGVASYTKNMLMGMMAVAKKDGRSANITVLAEKFEDEQENYTEKGINVSRIWKRKSLFSLFSLISSVFRHKDATTVMICFELAMFGGVMTLPFLPILLSCLRLMNKHVVFVSHHVVTKGDDVVGHMHLSNSVFITKALTWTTSAYFAVLTKLANKTVVFDQTLKNRLGDETNDSVLVIPHGIEDKKPVAKSTARKQLGIANEEFVIISFGYLAWYKGTDWLASVATKLPKRIHGKKIRIILAGGPNPNRVVLPSYQEYLTAITEVANKKHSNIMVTGFVSEEDIATYYGAADIVVFPYRTIFSSSGPLSLAWTYKKPVLVSNKMKYVFETSDIARIMKQGEISAHDVTFSLTTKSLQHALKTIQDTTVQKKLVMLADRVSKERSFETIGKQFWYAATPLSTITALPSPRTATKATVAQVSSR